MRCDHCGSDNPDHVSQCAQCGATLPARPPAPTLSRKAVWSVVLAVLGTCLPILLTLPAIILGVLALRDIGAGGGRRSGQSVAIMGIVLAVVCGTVGAIILMLAAIAIPNFMQAQTRAKIARALGEEHSLAVAIESFRVDQNRPPSLKQFYIGDLQYDVDVGPEMVQQNLTSPVAYLATMPADPFREGGWHYDYWTNGSDVWVIRSVGPDGVPDADLAKLGEALAAHRESKAWPPEHQDWIYDPSNGLKSPGDLMLKPW